MGARMFAFLAVPGMWAALAAAGGLLLITLAMAQGGLANIDRAVLAAFAALGGPGPDGMFQAVTWLGSGYVLGPAAILLIVPLALSRRWDSAWLMGITYFGAALTTWGLKQAIARERPTLYPALADFIRFDWSFPSGHATHAAAFALGLWLLMRESPARLRVLAGCALSGLVILVAASRLHLQVHWPSDVLAGLLVATFWAGLAASLARSGTTMGRAT